MNDNESPIQVLITVMLSIIVLAFVVLTMGTFTDGFMSIIGSLNIPLSIWGQNMMKDLVIRYSTWVFIVPGFFGLVIFVWGIKSMIKKHEYTKQQDEFLSDEL